MSRPSDMRFVTDVAKFTESESWPYIMQWFKDHCAQRMVAVFDESERNRIALEWHGARAFCIALENLVVNNEGLIDGRKSRWNKGTATGDGGSSGKRTK